MKTITVPMKKKMKKKVIIKLLSSNFYNVAQQLLKPLPFSFRLVFVLIPNITDSL